MQQHHAKNFTVSCILGQKAVKITIITLFLLRENKVKISKDAFELSQKLYGLNGTACFKNQKCWLFEFRGYYQTPPRVSLTCIGIGFCCIY